jgi:glutathione S-transferase fosA5
VTTGVNHITFVVRDLDRATNFYVEVIGCAKVATWNGGAYLTAGDMWLCLSLDSAASSAVARDYTHIAFTFDQNGIAAFRARLRAANGTEWKVNSSEGDSVYFLDPDGHRLEAHVGSLESRLAFLRESPYEGLELHAGTLQSLAAVGNRPASRGSRITTGCSGR